MFDAKVALRLHGTGDVENSLHFRGVVLSLISGQCSAMYFVRREFDLSLDDGYDVLISQLVCQTNPLRLMLHGRTIYDGMLELLND